MRYYIDSPDSIHRAASEIISYAKKYNVKRAVFRVKKGEIADILADCKKFDKQYEDFGGDLLGIYDKKCNLDWLKSDIERFAA